MIGTASTVTPTALVASAVVERAVESEACTAAAVVVLGTAMVAVMITKWRQSNLRRRRPSNRMAATTSMVTSEAWTPAAMAMLSFRLGNFENNFWRLVVTYRLSFGVVAHAAAGRDCEHDGLSRFLGQHLEPPPPPPAEDLVAL